MNPVKIIKNRSDIGAGTRGSDLGIDALEIAAINQGNDFFNITPFVDVKTHNESIYNKVKYTFAKRINFVLEQCIRIKKTTIETLSNGFFPLVLSGDHSSSLGTIAGVQTFFDDKKIGVIWIDAHADLHTPYSSPSGNVHGMPLAAAIGINNSIKHTLSTNESTSKNWNKMINMGIKTPILNSKNLIYFGVRDFEIEESEIISNHNIKIYSVNEIRNLGIKKCVNEALKRLNLVDIIYISFDVDALDCDLISKGTGTPVKKGFKTNEVISIIKELFKSNKVVALEVSEINPLMDNKGNKMAENAFETIKAVFNS
jgi:arginase